MSINASTVVAIITLAVAIVVTCFAFRDAGNTKRENVKLYATSVTAWGFILMGLGIAFSCANPSDGDRFDAVSLIGAVVCTSGAFVLAIFALRAKKLSEISQK